LRLMIYFQVPASCVDNLNADFHKARDRPVCLDCPFRDQDLSSSLIT
jgi:hypothetical protein